MDLRVYKVSLIFLVRKMRGYKVQQFSFFSPKVGGYKVPGGFVSDLTITTPPVDPFSHRRVHSVHRCGKFRAENFVFFI